MTGSADLVHGICGFGIDGGMLVPSLAEGIPEASVLEGRRLELHVFSSAVEAAAFSAGVTRAVRNGLHAVVGRNGAERVVAFDISEPDRPAPQHFADSVDPVDHGGLALQTASAGWWSLRTSLPDGLALDISSDGTTAELDAGTRRFTLSNEWGDVVASTTYRASDRRVSTALMCNWPTSGLDFDAVDKVLRVRIPTDAFTNRAGILSEVGRLVADEDTCRPQAGGPRDGHNVGRRHPVLRDVRPSGPRRAPDLVGGAQAGAGGSVHPSRSRRRGGGHGACRRSRGGDAG
ncbi:hypothetical protein [Methylobacterium radiotolerans]